MGMKNERYFYLEIWLNGSLFLCFIKCHSFWLSFAVLRWLLEYSEEMDAASEVGYGPPPEFQEDVKDPLIELSLSDSTELWLIQWPINQVRFL